MATRTLQELNDALASLDRSLDSAFLRSESETRRANIAESHLADASGELEVLRAKHQHVCAERNEARVGVKRLCQSLTSLCDLVESSDGLSIYREAILLARSMAKEWSKE